MLSKSILQHCKRSTQSYGYYPAQHMLSVISQQTFSFGQYGMAKK